MAGGFGPRLLPMKFDGKLILCTSFYQQQAHARYTHSMVTTVAVLERLGIKWDFWPISGDFHVERAINGALARFMADQDATDILLIDSDESWDATAVVRLLMRPEEVVGCAYRMKNNWEKYACQIKMENGTPSGYVLPDGTPFMRAERLPGGFLRLKKSVLEKFVAAYPDEWYWDGGDKPVKVPMFFHTTLRDNHFFSCDFNLCEKLKAIGVELWLDPTADISHWGTTEYPGNLDKFLRKKKKEREAFATVQEMAKQIA